MISFVRRIANSRYVLWAVLALPFVWIANGYQAGDLFYGEVIHVSGEFSARLLILTLAVTPLRLLFGNASWTSWLAHRRRDFGVASFAYAVLHTIVYLQRKGTLTLVLEEAADFSIWTGWLALFLFVPLAVTSNDASLRWLKKSWKKLHRLVYLAAVLTFTHWIFAAFDFVPGLVHFAVLLLLEACRIWKRRQLRLSSNTALPD